MKQYYVALGSNIGNRLDYLQQALFLLNEVDLKVELKSKIYETPPWGLTAQEPFLNGVIMFQTADSPEEILDKLLAIEKRCGRKRKERWGPRTLDLDIIFAEGISLATDKITLPHPYFWDRAFVLVPLADIAPDFIYQGQKIQIRLQELAKEEIKEYSVDWK